jgi:hypothetical protein
MYTQKELILLEKLKAYKGKSGLYIIKPYAENNQILHKICKKIPEYSVTSDVAYIGKGFHFRTTDLYKRSKQEMGWSNFSGATFMKKIGKYLGFSEDDNYDKIKRNKTRHFIVDNFIIELITLKCSYEELLIKEKNLIKKMKPCFNNKHIRQ